MPTHDWTRVIPGTFHDFHHEWISAIKRELNAGILPNEFYAMAEQVAGQFGPDVLTLGNVRESGSEFDIGSRTLDGGGGGDLLTAPPKTRFSTTTEAESYALRQKSVVVRHRSGDDVVAVVELLSPGNKSSRHAFEALVSKAIGLLAAGIHLLIVDLFPPGVRDPNGIHAVIWDQVSDSADKFELPSDLPLTLVSYAAGQVWSAFIEPVAVQDDLPDMPLFLTDDGHVLVPLQRSYETAFAGVPERWRRELR